MTFDIKLDEDGMVVLRDIPNGGVDLATVEGNELTAQSILVALGTWLGEDAFHPEIGLPIPSMVGARSQDFIRGILSDALLQIEEVRGVGNIDLKAHPDHEHVLQIGASVILQNETITVETTLES